MTTLGYPTTKSKPAVLLACAVAAAAVSGQEPGNELGVAVTDGRLTANLSNVPLRAVFERIASQTGIVVHLDKGADVSRISAHFSRTPIVQGLMLLLAGLPGSIIVQDPAHGYAGVSDVFIISSRGEAATLPAPPPATMAEIRRFIDSTPPREIPVGARDALDNAYKPGTYGTPPNPALRRAETVRELLRTIGSSATARMRPAQSPDHRAAKNAAGTDPSRQHDTQ